MAAAIISLCYTSIDAWYPVDLCYEFTDPLHLVHSSSISRVLYGAITRVDLDTGLIQFVTDTEVIWGKLNDDTFILQNGRPCSIDALSPVPGGFEQWGLVCLDQTGKVIYIEGIYPLFTVEMLFYDRQCHTVSIALVDEPTVTAELPVSALLFEAMLEIWSASAVVDVYLDWNGEIRWISSCEYSSY